MCAVAGGFEFHAKRIVKRSHLDYQKRVSQDAFKLGSSVYHHSKKTCSCSSYVSISASKDKATNFASKQTGKRTSLKRKRTGAPAGCDRVKNPGAEGEEVAKPGDVEGEETAKPGNTEDDELGPGGEKPDSGSGSEQDVPGQDEQHLCGRGRARHPRHVGQHRGDQYHRADCHGQQQGPHGGAGQLLCAAPHASSREAAPGRARRRRGEAGYARDRQATGGLLTRLRRSPR
ncbi:hypothetical protein BBAD15_g11958 [Beauveria bassiana D1-5]|uniref:Uncharacterized protein n=1 Tax=Beauveria bassiana D1-5 TaxID=1245745 RepID=A0A0A2V5Q5_BEABA|nr:hypothetical protein BBAD15_g11958 [Beauveria bassiana D1-5]